MQAHINAIKTHMPVRVIMSDLLDASALYDCTIVHNPYGTSMMSSIIEGITDLEDDGIVLIAPVDTVPIGKDDLMSLTQFSPPAVLSHQHQAGHPIWLSIQSIRNLHPHQTIRSLSEKAQHCESTQQCLTNFNYPQDWVDFFGQRPRRWNKNMIPTKK